MQVNQTLGNFQNILNYAKERDTSDKDKQLFAKDQQILEKENEKKELSKKYNNLTKTVKTGLLIIGAIIGAGAGYYFGNKKGGKTIIEEFKTTWKNNPEWGNEFGERALKKYYLMYNPKEIISKKFVRDNVFINEYLNRPESQQTISKFKKIGAAIGTAAGLAISAIGNMFIKNNKESETDKQ
jgi:hypothetical protein